MVWGGTCVKRRALALAVLLYPLHLVHGDNTAFHIPPEVGAEKSRPSQTASGPSTRAGSAPTSPLLKTRGDSQVQPTQPGVGAAAGAVRPGMAKEGVGTF